MRMLLPAACAVVLAAQPRIENARLQTRAVSGPLERDFRSIVASQNAPAWIGYTVAQSPGEGSMCGTVHLEGSPEFVMLYRVAAGQVEKIRSYSTDCTFEAGGLPIYWLTGVDGGQSASMLASFVAPGKSPLSGSALSTIARHRDGVPALIELARRPQLPAGIRQEAVRWLGRSKDPRAVRFFEETLAKTEPRP